MLWFNFAQDPKGPQGRENPKTRDVGEPLSAAPAGEEEYEDASDAVNHVLMSLMPWGISVLLHAGAALLLIFAVWSSYQEVQEDEVIVPIARLSQTPGAPITMQQTNTAKTTSAAPQRSVSKSTSQQSGAIGSGAGAGASSGSGAGIAAGLPGLIGAGASSGGGSGSPFSMGTGGSGQFKATFFGTGGNARKIVYLIDASGSLIECIPFVIDELKRSVGELSEAQSFAVIFFQGSEVVEVPPYGLKRATSENKRHVIQWVDQSSGNVVAQGLTSPLAALTKALTYRPQLMFILSDNITGQGAYEVDQRHLLRQISTINRTGTKINTIQFIYPDPLVKVGMKATMQLIADNTGGVYKYLDGRELGIE